MGFVQYFVALLMLSAHLVLSYPATSRTYTMNGRRCKLCPAGEFQASCTQCEPCPAGHYTDRLNREDSCHRCYGDCSPSFHLKVLQNCSSTTDVKCGCEDGFRCTAKVPYSENCRECVKMHYTTTTEAAATTAVAAAAAAAVLGVPGQDKHTHSSVSSGQGSVSSEEACKFPKCDSQSGPVEDTVKAGKPSGALVAILCSVFVFGCLALVILLCIRRPGDPTCFTQIIAKLYNKEGGNVAHKPVESSHQLPRDSFSAKQQPATFSAANQGPVHVHNPGTVIFSLLSQFTGQVGPTIECGRKPERSSRDEGEKEEAEGDCPTSPHSVPLSEEERSEEADCIFFPFQEQGKDYHMSKEEAL